MHMINHAVFSRVRMDDDKLFISDLCNELDSPSITNDAEWVVDYCLRMWGNRRIIYLDTMDEWWELKHDGKNFLDFEPYREGDTP